MDKYPITYRCDMCGRDDAIVHTVHIKAKRDWEVCFCRKCHREVMNEAGLTIVLDKLEKKAIQPN